MKTFKSTDPHEFKNVEENTTNTLYNHIVSDKEETLKFTREKIT